MRAADRRVRERAKVRLGLGLSCALGCLGASRGAALEEADIPSDAPQDAIMASPADIEEVRAWALAAFTGAEPPSRAAGVRVQVRRQDHSVLGFGQSCIDTPLKIGSREFAHGLGTHAASEIVLAFPAGAKAFRAYAGIDNNFDTQGRHGSARFSVEIDGKEVFGTPALRGGQEPVPVAVDVPRGTRAITLKVDPTADGAAYDQADWADARIVMEDGSELWADANRVPFLTGAPPFSFLCDGVSSASALAGWKRAAETRDEPSRIVHTVRWTDPASGLAAVATATAFKRYPAVEWSLGFENAGAADTPILSEIQVLDAVLRTGYQRTPVVLHQISGDVCGEQSFVPRESVVVPGTPVAFAPAGGRPSNQTFPFFNLQYGDQGLLVAIGWSGQWAVRLERAPNGPTRIRAGMEKTHLRLRPGERIRGPRILILPWKGDRIAAHNRLRRLLLFEYVPRLNGRPLRLPVASQCFDRYSWTRPEWSTEEGQIRAARAARAMGCDTHWFDAAWFEGGFPNGVGNWFCKPRAFPNGLRPVADACHAAGLEFLVWFEPERVAPGTLIAREHPEFVLGGKGGGLFDLGNDAARAWLTDLLSSRIREFGIDVYRNDFNIDPLDFWRRADAPDRQGMAEIRYVEGHYDLWDTLRERHAGLWIDNCASGGRRIDLETIMRSVPLWRSDTGCGPGHQDWDQAQVLGLSLYVPLYTSCAWEPRAYVLRSAATAGVITQFDYLNDAFSIEKARAALDEAKENQKYWYGDFYPLTRAATGKDAFAAWQLHRADLDAGIVLAFRRSECPFPVLQACLRALAHDGRYAVERIDEERTVKREVLDGRALMSDFELRVPARGTSLLVRYRRE
ncbi:MAG: NPCBM/NEW2 domain-containing protein [Planctomycetes bacterium]|nr:NPCBM/NEW2 domain-containing protein [Planctomycetota bacterium]